MRRYISGSFALDGKNQPTSFVSRSHRRREEEEEEEECVKSTCVKSNQMEMIKEQEQQQKTALFFLFFFTEEWKKKIKMKINKVTPALYVHRERESECIWFIARKSRALE